MGKNPAFQFYPADWERDLGEHPLEIRGAWITICCALWWSETPGHDTKTLAQWAKILRENQKKTEKILNYFTHTRIGDLVNQNGNITITSRRMVRDEYIRKIRKEAGEKGGNPVLKKGHDLLNQTSNQNASKSQPLHLQSSSSSSLLKEKEPSDRLSLALSFNQETQDALIKLQTKYPQFPAAKLMGIALYQKKHPDAILYALKETLAKCKGIDPGKYFLKILEEKSGNLYEDEHTKKSQKFKADFAGIAEKLKRIQ